MVVRVRARTSTRSPPSIGPAFVPSETTTTTVPTNPTGPGAGAAAAAAWLDGELAGGFIPGFLGTADWGLTADAVLALAAAGMGDSPNAQLATQALVDNIASFATFDDFAMPGVRLAGPLAKLLLVFAVQGEDVNDVGGWDVEAELRDVMLSDGHFADDNPFDADLSNSFGQSFAILGLDRTPRRRTSRRDPVHAGAAVPRWRFPALLRRARFGLCVRLGCHGPRGTGVARCRPHAGRQRRAARRDRLAARRGRTRPARGAGPGRPRRSTRTAPESSRPRCARRDRPRRPTSRPRTCSRSSSAVRPRPRRAFAVAAVVPADGAIAYDSAAYNAAVAQGGIDEIALDQFRRTTAQAVFALGLPSYGAINGQNPDPVTTTTITTTTTTVATATSTTAAVAAPTTLAVVGSTVSPTTRRGRRRQR